MQTLFQDLRYGARMILKNPTFTLIAVIALALGIGANTAIFSVVHAVLLEDLPYRDADRLAIVWEHNRTRNRLQNVVSPANFLDWKEQNSVFEDLAAWADVRANLSGDGEPEEVPVQYATPNLFSLLGVNAYLGRTLSAGDGAPDQPLIAVISHGLWQRRFGGDPGVINQNIKLNQRDVTIVGVLPANFKWFIQQGSITGKAPEMWLPYVMGDEFRVRRGRFISVVARLKSEVPPTAAQAEMQVIGNRLEEQYKDFNGGWGINVVPLRKQLTGDISTALWVLLGTVAFVLLIACANVANLLLARAAVRQKEIAVRVALGASRWSILRQLLTESLLLSLLSGAVGLLLAMWGTEVLVSLSPPNLLNLEKVEMNPLLLSFTLAVSLLTGLLFGLVPALEASHPNIHDSLKESGRNLGGNARSHRLRNTFVVAEVALSLVLLVGAGLLIRSSMRLQAVDPGFNPENLLTMRLQLPTAKYRDDRQRIEFYNRALAQLQSLPGVESAGAIQALPFAAPAAGTGFEIEGQPPLPSAEQPNTRVLVTDATYFRTVQTPLLKGRLFNEQEATEMRHVVVINQMLADRFFPGEDPIGKRITIYMKEENLPSEIIGVVGDARHTSLDTLIEPTVFWPYPELTYNSMTLLLRTTGDASTIAQGARNVITGLDSDQPVSDIRTMESVIGTTLKRAQFSTLLLGLFAGIALILSAVGIYGVMSYSVAQRTQEIGIRMALGAKASDVLKMVIRQGMALTVVGIAIGLVAAFGLTRLMATLLFEISASDPLTFAAIAGLLAAIAALACFIPARRATKVDPMVALRYE